MKIVKNLLIGLLAVIALFFVVGLFLPDEAHVERSITIEAAPDDVYALLNSFRRFNEWSPWAELDPDMEYVYEGPESGVGAKMSWSSDDPGVGSGSQEIIASEPGRLVKTALEFGDQGTAIATYTLEPVDYGTRVTWAFDTSFGLNVPERYIGLMFESMIGPDYERGLANLKVLAESIEPAAEPPEASDVEIVQIEPATLVFVSGTTTQEADDIGHAFADAYARIERFIEQHDLRRAGPARAIVNFWDESGYGFDAAVPVEAPAASLQGAGDVKIGSGYAGRAACARHLGPYTEIGATHEMIEAHMALHDLEPGGKSWEEYLTDPAVTAEAELATRVCYPIAGD